jgi:Rne/Rng family ribonuclease
LNGDVHEAVAEIHATEGSESHGAEEAHAAEDDSEEIELEEAQAEAEAMLDAEARGNGTVDARVEVRAPAGTAGYTQRSQRQRSGYDRGYERRGGRRGGGGQRRFRRRESAPVPLISDLLKEGQEILVQIAKEPIGKKGARITSHIALPGRFLVYMPTVNHTGVSRKISSEEERQRLKRIILSERENGHGGFIVRTAAQSASEDELRADIRFLKGLWQDIKNRAENSKPPALIYHDLNVVERVLRDQVTSDFSVIWVDTETEYERILRFFNRFQPAMVKRVKLYTKETPLFEQFGLTEEMNKALKSKVWLKSGGYIVINQTEALVAIDINTGKYVGKTQRLEDTIVKTNVDAIKEIVRQIRLRDLGGIIIIDFIDMDERRNRQRVMQALEEELRHDRAPSKTLQFNDFGLVAITRKRVKQSLERTIGAPCPYCQSTGYVKSVTTICNEIYVEMRKIAKHLEHEDVMLRVHPDVAKELKSSNGRLLNEMEELTKRTIIVKSDPAVHQEQFDIN